MVPPMMIQPLLENAFNHGPHSSPMPMVVEVEALMEKGWLLVTVSNSGNWIERDAQTEIGDHGAGSPSSSSTGSGTGSGTGIGLSNLRKRLNLLLGEEATLEISGGAERVNVMIRIPSHPEASCRHQRTPSESMDAAA
jgi:sensor histidine kinase YesM